MKKNLFICLFSFFISSNLVGQNTFQKDIGITFDTSFIHCQPDGKAFYLVGQINRFNQIDIHFLKISDVGNLLWHKLYSTPSSFYELKKTILQRDGLLALFSGKDSAFLLKMNLQDGNTTWRKDFGQGEKMMLFDVASDGKENIWLGGLHYKKTEKDSNYYFHLKLDRNGSPIMGKQTRTYYNGMWYLDDRVYKPTDLLWNPFTQSMFMVQNYPTGEYTKTSFPSGNGNLDNRRVWIAIADTNMRYKEHIYSPDFGDWVKTRNHISFGGWTDFPEFHYQIGLLDSTGENLYKWRDVDGKMKSIHNYDGSIIFYNLKYKTLIKYNELLEPIWTKKYDNCYNTTAFDADIAQDGSIFTVRNVGEKTIVSKINADGTLPNCIDYTTQSVENSIFLRTGRATIDNLSNTNYAIPIVKDTTIKLVDKTTTFTPFCIKIDARFQIPDTLCVNTEFVPTNVDTAGAIHAWEFNTMRSDKGYPKINFESDGQKKVFHSVQKGSCKDSTSRYIAIIPEPFINAKDTVICEKKEVIFNLTTKYAKGYFIDNQPISPIKTIDSSGIFTFKITNKSCSTEKKVKVKINNYTVPEFKQIGVPCQNEAYPIVFGKAFKNIIWDNRLIKSDTVFVNNNAVHNYSITYVLDSNCVERGTIKINRKTCTDIFIPTAFSPNNDQINDELQVFSQANFKVISLSIFDRWGELVFKSSATNLAWDGTFKGQSCTEGIYIYVVKYLNTKTLKEEIVAGDVTLMR